MKNYIQLLSKIGIIVFLALIVLGFTVPGFLNQNPETNPTTRTEPRLCQTDADCYLICQSQPLRVLCSQNLCQQNSCEEGPLFKYEESSRKLTLDVSLYGERINLTAPAGNFFATFSENEVQAFALGMTLQQILEKTLVSFNNQCLNINGQSYCRNESDELQLLVNGNRSFSYENYVPQDGDKIKVDYSSVSS